MFVTKVTCCGVSLTERTQLIVRPLADALRFSLGHLVLYITQHALQLI